MNLYKYLIITFLVLSGGSAMADEWFPKEYKVFKYKEGDLLSSQIDGKWGLTKILKINKVALKRGDSISILGQVFTAPIDDYLLVISTAFSESEFSSIDELKIAVKNHSWKIKIGHVPRRVPGVSEDSILLGNEPVSDTELVGYKQWKEAFDKNEAGIF